MECLVAVRLTLLVLSLMLSSCGFHLRTLSLSDYVEQIHVSGTQKAGGTGKALIKALGGKGIRLVDINAANYVLKLSDEDIFVRSSSISEGGHVLEHEIELSISFSVTDAEGMELVPKQVVEVNMPYWQSPDALLAGDIDRSNLLGAIRSEAAEQIVAVLTTALTQ